MITHNFPAYNSPFVGREEELSRIASALNDPACRLLTLTGPGGMGKTRLALEAPRVQSQQFQDGTFFISLQALNSSEFVVRAIAEALDFQFSDDEPPRQQLLDYLNKKSCLLVLDNFEHLLDAATLIEEITRSAPNVKTIITSRERLNLREEWILEISGLPFPPDEAESSIEQYDAVALFVQHAQRVHSSFFLDEKRIPAVIRICRLVEGMPLGIELAAAWVRVLPCEQIATEIERSLDILETPARNMPPRHRNIRAVFSPTWERLSAVERNVFMKLSVFRGGFTLDAATQVAEASLQTLSALVDQSLLRIDANERYIIHELLRQFGEEQIVLSGMSDAIHNSHSVYYTSFLKLCWSRLTGNDIKSALHEINIELENIRMAWDGAVNHRKAGEIEAALDSLWFYYDQGSRYHEGVQLFASAVNRLQTSSSDQGDLWAKVLARYGALCRMTLLRERSKVLLEESVILLRRTGATHDLAFALARLSAVTPEDSKRQEYLEESLALYNELGDPWGISEVLNWLCNFYLEEHFQRGSRENLGRIQRHVQEILTVNQQLGRLNDVARGYLNLGETAYCLGEYDQAREHFTQSLALFQNIDIYWGIPKSLWYLGYCSCALGYYADARRFSLQGLQIILDLSITSNAQYIYPPLIVVAEIWLAEGEIERAYELFALADQWRQTVGFSKNYIEFRPLSRLDGDLPANLVGAVARGRKRDLETVVQEVRQNLVWREPKSHSAASQSANHSLVEALSERELDVLRLIAQGLTNSEIAERLGVGESTVKKHINHLYGKLDVQNRTQALLRAQEWKLV